MTTKPRPSLSSMFAKKGGAVSAEPVSEGTASPDAVADTKDKRVQVLVRMTPAERKALRRIALEQDTTVQAIVEDAIRDVLRRHDG